MTTPCEVFMIIIQNYLNIFSSKVVFDLKFEHWVAIWIRYIVIRFIYTLSIIFCVHGEGELIEKRFMPSDVIFDNAVLSSSYHITYQCQII